MLSTCCVSCPAKLNFGLKVLPKRLDGYHDIESIFSTISLCDELEVKVTGTKDSCAVTCDSMELPQKNTITSTYAAFKELTGIELPGVSVNIRKHIPAGGGLGGGSSDAAGFLKALDLLCRTNLSTDAMNDIASKVGSDVFFFLRCDSNSRGCAVVTGRGENVRPISRRDDLHFLLIFPGLHSSTKEAYDLVDRHYEAGGILEYPQLDSLEEIYNQKVQNWNFVNTFTDVISSRYSIIKQAVFDLKKAGALFADMSGSGSTVFGVFDSKAALLNAQKKLGSDWSMCSTF